MVEDDLAETSSPRVRNKDDEPKANEPGAKRFNAANVKFPGSSSYDSTMTAFDVELEAVTTSVPAY